MRNEELHSLYVSVITSRTMRWAYRWKDWSDGKMSLKR